MKRRLFQIMEGAPWALEFAGGSSVQHERTLYPLLVCLALVVCITAPVQVEGGVSKPWAKSSMWGSWQDIQHANSLPLYRVDHLGPERSTEGHDYYDPSSKKLNQLVEDAHVKQIMPNIKLAFSLGGIYKKRRLEQALREINYSLHRIVNNPKALALSATVANLLGRPKIPINYYERAIRLYPKPAMPWAQYGNFLVGLGEFEDGIKRLKVAIEIDPNLAPAYGWLAWAYEKNGNSELAEEYTKKAKEKGFKGKLPKRSYEE
jgi:tetratricopeptide (TPR) repeat protein